MAEPAASNGATASIESTTHLPIAQLTPLLSAPSTRSVKAIVTLTWPYSSATGSVAFLLVEPDFRLRRTRGQVRVQFSGSSAKAVAKAGIASGDVVILALEGVEWVKDTTPFATPGRGVEFELKFTERLLLQFRQEDSQDSNLIDVDHPAPEPEDPPAERDPSPETAPSPYASPYTISNLNVISAGTSPTTNNGDEWSSPAFAKRARISYGSMFENDYDPFALEDGSVRGKGRKRTRLSSSWRYQSRSPTPEVENEDLRYTSSDSEAQAAPRMADEASQTVGLEDGGAAEGLADLHKQATSVGSSSYEVAVSERQKQAQTESLELADVPMIQIQTATPHEMPNDPTTAFQTLQKVPLSPRLQPIPSDSLPLVSPLVTTKYGALFGISASQSITGQLPSFTEQSPTPVQETVQEDLYGASPVAVYGELSGDQPIDFQDPSAGFNALEQASNMQDQFVPVYQYGQWQADGHVIPGGSQHPSVGEVREEQDDYYDQEQEDGLGVETNDFATAEYEQPSSHQYPDPEELSYGQQPAQSWGTAVNYPDLPNPDGQSSHAHKDAHQGLLPDTNAMSRSQSARSNASNAVDLTSDSEEEQPDHDSPNGRDATEEEEEVEFETPDEGMDDGKDQPPIESGRHVPAARGDGDQDLEEDCSEDDEDTSMRYDRPIHENELGSQDSQDEEGPYDEDMYDESGGEEERRYQEYLDGLLPGEEQDYDEDEEEIYDDEMEEESEQPPRTQGPPVVIDLLSSDDEDDPPQKAAENEVGNDEESDLGGDMDEEMDEDQKTSGTSAKRPSGESWKENSEDEDGVDQSSYEDDEHMEEVQEDTTLLAMGDNDRAELSDEETSVVEPTKPQDTALVAEVLDHVLDDGSRAEEKESSILIEGSVAQIDEISEGMVVDEAEPENADGDEGDLLRDTHETQTFQPETEEEAGRLDTGDTESTSTPDVQAPGPKPDEGAGYLSAEEAEATVEMHSPPPRGNLFNQMFNLDGANDEPESLSSRPKRQVITMKSETIFSSQRQARHTADKSSKHANIQLPTPDDTQLSFLKEASDLSMSSVMAAHLEVGATFLERETSTVTVDEPIIELTAETASPKVSEVAQAIEAPKTRSRMRQQTGSVEPNAHEEAAEVVHDLRPRTRKQTSVEPVAHEAEEVVHGLRSRSNQTGSVEPNAREDATDVVHDLRSTARNQSQSVGLEAAEVTHDLRSRTRLQNGSVEPVAHKEVTEDTSGTPRRSHRRVISETSSTEAPQTKPPSTPKSHIKPHQDEPASARTDSSMPMIPDEQETPKGHDASVELAMSALDSRAKQPHDLRSNVPGGPAKLKLNRVLRTELTEFTSLKLIRYHLTHKLDVLAVVTSTPAEPERAKNGPRHYQIIFNVTDQSIAPTAVTEIRVYRPYKDALPVVRVGDRVLLRQFEVISAKNRGFALVSTDTSAWAIFTGVGDRVDVKGPPVEYGDGEVEHIAGLRSWFDKLEPKALEKIHKANHK